MKRSISNTVGLVIALSGFACSSALDIRMQVSAQGIGALGTEQIKPREKRRIAVLDFDFSSISDMSYLSGFGGDGASKGISNLLTNQLVKEGSYILIERSRIDAVLAEQNLGASGRIEPTTAAQIGRILGVDAVLIGAVTKFDMEDKSKGFSFGGIFGGSRKQIATVQIAARLINTATGEILTVAEGTGQSEQKDATGGVGLFGTTSSSDSRGRVLGEAAEKAVAAVSTQLVAAAPKLSSLPTLAPRIDALVADVTGNQVVINKGGRDGFRPGMVLSVERVIKSVKDPSTGKVLRVVSQPIGRVQLVEVDATSSVGKVIAGKGGGFRVGDRAKAVE
ncbi:CsgG/HfaB family protein [Altericista sp. CCNU0014]|uniref:CsgG/HfaB family protein n=1 Tax=Altericista sp. CCNU0014 TaxID=3082949 RepID=UPI00384D6C9C